MPEFNIENEISKFMQESGLLDSLPNDNGDEDTETLDSYQNIIRLMMKTFGVSAVVHQFMTIRFSNVDNGMSQESANSAASGFLMGLQMGVRHPDWASAIVADLDDDDEQAKIAHQGQDSLKELLPMD